MKIAFTTKGSDWDSEIDSRFGRTEYILIYNDENEQLTSVDNRAIENEDHGAGPLTAQKLFEYKPDVLITGNGPGGNASRILEKSDIQIYIGAGNLTVKKALDEFKNNRLTNKNQ